MRYLKVKKMVFSTGVMGTKELNIYMYCCLRLMWCIRFEGRLQIMKYNLMKDFIFSSWRKRKIEPKPNCPTQWRSNIVYEVLEAGEQVRVICFQEAWMSVNSPILTYKATSSVIGSILVGPVSYEHPLPSVFVPWYRIWNIRSQPTNSSNQFPWSRYVNPPSYTCTSTSSVLILPCPVLYYHLTQLLFVPCSTSWLIVDSIWSSRRWGGGGGKCWRESVSTRPFRTPWYSDLPLQEAC